jgi:tetratricopeptide (TPR) repeat protein
MGAIISQELAEPTRPQVERQLQSMLESPIFSSREQQAKVLTFLVSQTLEGRDVSEPAIRQALFSYHGYKPNTNVVRVTIDALRTTLTEYNDRHDDLVIISLPKPPPGIKSKKGEAYVPHFEFNLHRRINKDYALGFQMMQRGFLTEYVQAVEIFQNIIDEEPDHAGAMICLAECLCFIDTFAEVPAEMRGDFLARADDLTRDGLRLAPRFWRAHAARALLHCCRGDYGSARQYFDEALKLDRDKTESQTLYSVFLMKNRRAAEALRLTEHLAEQQFNDPVAQCVYAIHLYQDGRLDEAENTVQMALRIDRNLWLAHVVAVYVYAAFNRFPDARLHARRLELLLDDPAQYKHWMSGVKLPAEAT